MTQIKVAQFGLGPIGIESIKLVVEKPWAELVGAVDVDPQKYGKAVAELTGKPTLNSIMVYPSFDALWEEAQPQVILHTAGSCAEQAIQQIEPMVRRGVSVVSSCEELLYPQLRAPQAAAALDDLCQVSGARVLGTGVNPGFVMDVLPVCLTGACREVQSIYVERVVNASTRRLPLQKKIGSGMQPDQFRQLFREGKIGHAGLRESLSLIAHSMGWSLSEVAETCEPVLADHDLRTEYFQVKKGLTCGLHQHAEGKSNGQIKVTLDLKMCLDASDPHDLVRIIGKPPVEALVRGGIQGDDATVAALVNAVPRIFAAPPGLRLMTELSVPAWK